MVDDNFMDFKKAFDAIDLDKSGYITAENLAKAFYSINQPMQWSNLVKIVA